MKRRRSMKRCPPERRVGGSLTIERARRILYEW